jgi:hypothetical protein
LETHPALRVQTPVFGNFSKELERNTLILAASLVSKPVLVFSLHMGRLEQLH